MRVWRKHRVKVTLVAEQEVEIWVDAADGDEPTDLTPAEEIRALADASDLVDWKVSKVELVAPPTTSG